MFEIRKFLFGDIAVPSATFISRIDIKSLVCLCNRQANNCEDEALKLSCSPNMDEKRYASLMSYEKYYRELQYKLENMAENESVNYIYIGQKKSK